MDAAVTEQSSSLRRWGARLLTALATLTPPMMALSNAERAEAANNPIREKAAQNAGLEAWKVLREQIRTDRPTPDEGRLWNILQTVLHVSDTSGMRGLDQMRIEILTEGATNPRVPARVVHGALYTSAVIGLERQRESAELTRQREQLSQQREEILCEALASGADQETIDLLTAEVHRRLDAVREEQKKLDTAQEELARAVAPYLGMKIVDCSQIDGSKVTSVRLLAAPSEISSLASKYQRSSVYDAPEFHRLAAFAMGRLNSEPVMKSAAEKLALARSTGERAVLVDLFLLSEEKGKLPNSVVTTVSSWVAAPPAPKTPLKNLSAIDERLVSVHLAAFDPKDEAQRSLIAHSILLMARAEDPRVAALCAQWFSMRGIKENAGPLATYSSADYAVLEALFRTAMNDESARKVCERMAATNPQLVLANVVLAASAERDAGPRGQANAAFMRLVKKHPAILTAVVDHSANRSGKTLWEDPSQTDPAAAADRDALETARDIAQQQAYRIMAFVDKRPDRVEMFRKQLADPLASARISGLQRDLLRTSIAGVAMAQDKGSFGDLIRLGVDRRVDSQTRAMALQAILHCETPTTPMPTWVTDRAKNAAPFSVARTERVLAPARGERIDLSLLSGESLPDVFRAASQARYAAWSERRTAMESARLGDSTILPGTKGLAIWKVMQVEGSPTGGWLKEFSGEKSFQDRFLDPLVRELADLKSAGGSSDIAHVHVLINVLARSQWRGAEEVLLDVATTPEKYVATERGNPFAAAQRPESIASVKLAAIDALGAVSDLERTTKTGDAIFTWLSQGTNPELREAATSALARLASRFEGESTSSEAVTTVRSAYLRRTLELVDPRAKNARLTLRPATLFSLCKIATRLGGAEDVAALAISKAGPEGKAVFEGKNRPEVVRAAMQSLASAGYTAETVTSLAKTPASEELMVRLFRFTASEGSWLADVHKRLPDAKSLDVAVVDACYVLPLPIFDASADAIRYPEQWMDWYELIDNTETHATAVAWILYEQAKVGRIHSYNANAGLPPERFRPAATQSPLFRAIEDIAEGQITGRTNLAGVNYSIGIPNRALFDPVRREEYLGQVAAALEVLSHLEVPFQAVAAGNSGGVDLTSRFGPLGELNNLPVSFDRDGKPMRMPPGIYPAGAFDSYRGAFAPFSSLADERTPPDDYPIFYAPGMNTLVPELNGGKVSLDPGSGTSYASPYLLHLLLRGEAYRRAEKIPNFDARIWRAILEESVVALEDETAVLNPAKFADAIDSRRRKGDR